MLAIRRSVQRAISENIKQPAGIAVLREKGAVACKPFRGDEHSARKDGGGM